MQLPYCSQTVLHFALLFHGPKLKSVLKALFDIWREEGEGCYSLKPDFVEDG